MPESIGEFNSLTLHPIEKQQLYSQSRDLDAEDIEILAWQIGTNPQIYNEVIPNPYSDSSQEILKETFPDDMFYARGDVMRAIALAEPEGAYDRRIRDMSHEERRDVYIEQLDKSADMVVRISQKVLEEFKTFWDMPRDQIYSSLITSAFGTDDIATIQDNFSKEQRRSFRFGVVNFIEDMNVMRGYKELFDKEPTETLENILKKPFNYNAVVTSTPFGFMAQINQDDYEQFTEVINKEKAIFASAGVTIFYKDMPRELKGKIGLINMGGERGEKIDIEKLKRTILHEWRHIIFAGFFDSSDFNSPYIGKKAYPLLNEKAHYDVYADLLKKHFSQYAQDEVIAYFSTGNRGFLKKDFLGGNYLHEELDKIKDYIEQQDRISSEDKESMYEEFHKQLLKYHTLVDSYQIIAAGLYQKADDEVLSLDKVTALLQLTPINKSERLLPYIGITPQEFKERLARRKKAIIGQVAYSVGVLVKEHDGEEPLGETAAAAFESISDTELGYIESVHPVEVYPILKHAIPGINSPYHVESFLTAAEMILYLHHNELPPSEIETLRDAIGDMITNRTDESFDEARASAEGLVTKINTDYLPNHPQEDLL